LTAAENGLRDGADQSRRVSRWVRLLADRERIEEGKLGAALAAPPEQKSARAAWDHVARELFADLYGMTAPAPDAEPKGEHRPLCEQLLGQAAQLPEWGDLAARSRGKPWACGIAAAEALRALSTALPEEPEQKDGDEPGGEPGDGEGDGTGSGHGLADAIASDQTAQAKMRDALRRAASVADGQIDETERALRGFGCGDEPGAHSACSAPADEVLTALREDPALRRVAALAGRLRVAARQAQRSKIGRGSEEVCDVKPGDDLQRMLPAELVQLADEDLEALWYRRVLEHSALCYELRGREKEERGPIVVCLDRSGSMSGAPAEWSAAVALALLEVAARQKRGFALLAFDTQVIHRATVKDPRSVSLDELRALVSLTVGGGTDFGPPLSEASSLIESRGGLPKADVILVSDGQAPGLKAGAEKLHKQGAALYGVAIGCDWGADAKFCDGYARLASVGSDRAALDLVFGIG
jgi:Mg-chelatase subunit ChlD